MADASPITIARFWSKVEVGRPADCWPWQAATSSAEYGRFKIDGVLVSPHRFAFELVNGPIPQGPGYHGTVIRHTCDNSRCCNPAHMALGSQRDNVRDMIDRGRQGDHSRPRILTPEQEATICEDPRSHRDIAARYGVSKSLVSKIKLRVKAAA